MELSPTLSHSLPAVSLAGGVNACRYHRQWHRSREGSLHKAEEGLLPGRSCSLHVMGPVAGMAGTSGGQYVVLPTYMLVKLVCPKVNAWRCPLSQG